MKRSSLFALVIALFASALTAQTTAPSSNIPPPAKSARKAHRPDWAKLKAGGAIKRFATAPKASIVRRDASGRVTQVLEPNAQGRPTLQTDIAYNANGKVLSITQKGASGDAPRVRTFDYDDKSRVVTATSPEAGTTTYTYDAYGNIATKTDARNLTISYTWDAKRRLLGKTYSSGEPTAHLAYDDKNHTVTTWLGTLDKPLDKRAYQYDAHGHLNTLTMGSGDNKVKTTLQYDPTGRLVTITYPDGTVVNQAWDTKGRLDSITSATTSYLSSPTYSATNTLTDFTLGGTTSVHREFDKTSRLGELIVRSRGQLLLDKTYDYNPAGEVTRFIDKLDKDASYRYIYDELNRIALAQQTEGDGKTSFRYDAFGNRAASVTADEKPKFTARNRFPQTSELKYDDSGDLTFDGTHTYTYNADGYIVSVDHGAVTYTYDAEGNRISRRVKTADGEAVTEFVWLNGQLTAQHQPDGRWIDYIYTGDKRIASVATHVDPVTGNPVADATTYFLTDTVGLTRAAFTSDGTILTEGDFSPFGEELRDRTQHPTHGIGSAASISFSDEVHDDETGLDTYKFRSYNPRLGRWMSPDPSSLRFSSLANPQSFNMYAYVTNDPLKYIDKLGLEECDCADDDGWYEDEGLSGGGGGGGSADGSGGGTVVVTDGSGGSVDVTATTEPAPPPTPSDPGASTIDNSCPSTVCDSVSVNANPDPPLNPTPSDPSVSTIPADPVDPNNDDYQSLPSTNGRTLASCSSPDSPTPDSFGFCSYLCTGPVFGLGVVKPHSSVINTACPASYLQNKCPSQLTVSVPLPNGWGFTWGHATVVPNSCI
jgi:RHS repeat-associated protein